MNENRRRSIRYPFVDTAEITNEKSTWVIAARLRDLSLHGCYIQCSLPQGTPINIRIAAGNAVFKARGIVVYSQPSGAGVEFHEVEQRYQIVLEEWLLEAQNLDTANRFAE